MVVTEMLKLHLTFTFSDWQLVPALGDPSSSKCKNCTPKLFRCAYITCGIFFVIIISVLISSTESLLISSLMR